MKSFQLLFLVSVLMLITCCCFADLPDSLRNKGYYEQLRIKDDAGKNTILYNANIRDDSITGFTSSTDSITVHFDSISKLEYKTGSAGEKITLVTTCIGAAVGLVITFSMMAYDVNHPDPNADEDDEETDNTDVYMIPIYICGGAGFLIGLPFMGIGPKYKTLYDESTLTRFNPKNLRLTFAMSDLSKKSNKYLGLSYRF